MNDDLDYDGDMCYFQEQLLAKGITKEIFDLDNFVGLTKNELQNLVDSIHLKSRA